MSYRMPRRHYADIYGPTTGDRVRLGDTDLVAEVERDHTSTATNANSAEAKCCATAWARRPASPKIARWIS